MREAIEARLNAMKIETVYKADGNHFRWKGKMPEGIDILAPFANCFGSEKNLDKWLKQCGVAVSKFDEMSRNELVEYANKELEYDLKLGRKKKEELIAEIQEVEDGILDPKSD